MKILTEKDQLRNKLVEIDESIKYSRDEMNKAYRRKKRKTNWGIFSFISEASWLLFFTYERKLTKLKLIEEYREVISDRLLK
jgi:hypothetical protein